MKISFILIGGVSIGIKLQFVSGARSPGSGFQVERLKWLNSQL